MKALLFFILCASSAFADMSPTDPRWKLVEAFNARKQYENARMKAQVQQAKDARLKSSNSEALKNMPDLRPDGIPCKVFAYIQSKVKDSSSVRIVSAKELMYDSEMKSWQFEVTFTSKNSMGGFSRNAICTGFIGQFTKDYMDIIW